MNPQPPHSAGHMSAVVSPPMQQNAIGECGEEWGGEGEGVKVGSPPMQQNAIGECGEE